MFQRKTKPLEPTELPVSKYATPQLLQRIRAVVQDTTRPSWLPSMPQNFGDANAGTLKADEWRSLATIYLPLALVSFWGEGTVHSSPDYAKELRQVLDHTMALFAAVRLACLRTMTLNRRNAYQSLMIQYIHDLPNIHFKEHHRPNHHMALHVPHFLTLFGPVRSWWCFPFERLIGLLQQISSNHKLGKDLSFIY
jgi:hypothetical protein